MTHLASLSDLALQTAHLKAVADGDNVLADAAWNIFVSRHSLNERGWRDPIVTYHAFPPIPVRDFDWQAHRDSDEGGEGLSGWGRTEAEAILDLLDLENEADDLTSMDEDEQAAERRAAQEEYERDEAADAKRQARRDDDMLLPDGVDGDW